MALISDRRLRVGMSLIAAVLIVGTAGYTIIEGWSFLDSLFMTVITISTVGFAIVGGELSSAGKIFTIVIIFTGVGSALYTAAVGLEDMVESLVGGHRLRRRMQQQIDKLSHHVIVCGYGTVGTVTVQRLVEDGESTVVIEVSPSVAEAAREEGLLVVEGDATHDHILEAAGLSRARAIVPAVRSDSDNLVITLSAKAARADVLVVARATEAETVKKLKLAGADRVVAPQQVGAERLASLAARPELTDLIDVVVSGVGVEYHLAELVIEGNSRAAGRTLHELDVRRSLGVLVLAVGPAGGEMMMNPDADAPLTPNTRLLAFGNLDQLDALRDYCDRRGRGWGAFLTTSSAPVDSCYPQGC